MLPLYKQYDATVVINNQSHKVSVIAINVKQATKRALSLAQRLNFTPTSITIKAK